MSPLPDDTVDCECVELALRESESCFRVLCETSPAGICVVQGGVICYVNPALAEILGRPREQFYGQSPLVFLHPDEHAWVADEMVRRLSGTTDLIRYEARALRGDGEWVQIEVFGTCSEYHGAPALVGTVFDISERKRAAAAAQDRFEFERLLADLSARFVNVTSEDLDATIESSLTMLIEALGNDRSSLARFTDDKRYVTVSHSYAVAGCEAYPLGAHSHQQLPWYIGRVRRGEPVFLRNLPDDLPPEAENERRYCIAQGMKSNVAIPLKAGGEVLGAITFAFLRQPCQWSVDMITRLQMIGEVFANALQHQRADEALRAALAENEVLRSRLEQENQYLREQTLLKHHHGRMVGESAGLRAALAAAERVAVTDAPVLLFGETGTGKELLAQTIHELSSRKDRAMVVVNCASLPATLVESELFGRVAGAYTGAASAQVGRFAVADGSTLFLDEIGEFPVELQAKLLRVLQDGRFERLGSPETIHVDVRIIAATNRDLAQAVTDGKFRADLYHRLDVFPIRVPPLRERREDIPLLAWAFVETIGRRMGKTIKNISRRTMDQLQRYAWPGNVRELSNVIERAMILSNDDTLHVELPSIAKNPPTPHMTLKDRERAQIQQALNETGWRIRGVGGAAELLGLKPTTLEARMAKLGIKREKRRSNIS